MKDAVRVLGFGGSLREGSYSQTLLEISSLLQASSDACPEYMTLEIFDGIGDFPLYNQELEQDMPETVVNFKQKIEAADAILIVTPEYNYSVSGVLKNAIDWASRPYGESAWDGKPAAILGASTGSLGTARAQYHLRQILVTLNMYALNRPEVMIANASNKFDDQ